jgi:integrase
MRNNLGGSTSFCVDAGYVNGKRQRKFFPTKKEAKTYAKQLGEAWQQQGALAFKLNAEQQVDASNALKELEGTDGTLTVAAAYYRKYACPKGGKKRIREIVAEILEAKATAGNKPRTIKEFRCKFARFKKTFGEVFLSEITREAVEEWLNSQKTGEGEDEKPFSLQSKENYLRDLGILFRFAVKRNYCAENVIDQIEKPRVPESIVEFFTPSEAMKLLYAAHIRPKLELVPYLAIGLFAGLRAAELEKLDWNQINLCNRTIQVTPENSKTGRNRLVEISDNLLAWLKPHEKMDGPVTPKNSCRRKTPLLELAKITKWPDNGLRHSFGTYHCAFHQNAPKTAGELGHESTKMLYKHYRSMPVTKAEATDYWNIMPPKKSTPWMMPSPCVKKPRKPKFHGQQEVPGTLYDEDGQEFTVTVTPVKSEQAAA